ncbi:hypothetical protein ASF99_13225 [Exiguobacterium sp. Leaf187]|uniref:hypothetical protein n=1 Tax=Exiguobacterium TaxID=33986 RepID=UPI0006F9792C|nr:MULTISPECIES: hypothetical protein [Exiguobacterium]KQS23462.1 hypothetical protein ASF99_13225 [Exiguobacterium sp. Leaf187]
MEKNKNDVEALVSSNGISIAIGDRVVNGTKMNFTNGLARISAKNTSSNAVMGVHIVDVAGFDEPVKEWFLQPGQSLNQSNIKVKKDYLYLRLTSYSQNATGHATLTKL